MSLAGLASAVQPGKKGALGSKWSRVKYQVASAQEQGLSLAEEIARANRPKRFAPAEIKDKGALSIFVIHLVAIVCLSVLAWRSDEEMEPPPVAADGMGEELGRSGEAPRSISRSEALLIYTACGLLAGMLSLLWFLTMKRLVGIIIKVTLGAGVGLMVILSVMAFAKGYYGWALIWLATGAISGTYAYLIRKRIPFATLLLVAALRVTTRFPAMMVLAYCSLLVQMLWIGFWTVTWMNVWVAVDYNSTVALLLVGSLQVFWTSQVIKNVVSCTVSGTAAYWYFMFDSTLGSVALGSLFTALLKALRAILDTTRKSTGGDPTFVVLIAAFFLRWVDILLHYFNAYAFTYLAVYGDSWIGASKATWKMLHECGLDAVLNDDIIGGTMLMAAFLVAAATGFVGAAWALALGIERWFWGVGAPCALMGFILGIVALDVVESTTLAIYVCFADDPDSLYYNDKSLYNKLSDAQELGAEGDVSSDSEDEWEPYDSDESSMSGDDAREEPISDSELALVSSDEEDELTPLERKLRERAEKKRDATNPQAAEKSKKETKEEKKRRKAAEKAAKKADKEKKKSEAAAAKAKKKAEASKVVKRTAKTK